MKILHKLTGRAWPVSSRGDIDIRTRVSEYGGWHVYVIDQSDPEMTPQVLTTKDKLEEIRDIFGLSVSNLAGVLRVSRPSLHAWLKGEEPNRDLCIERIDRIYQIALHWKRKTPFHYSPGRLIRQPLADGPSLLQRMEAEKIDEIDIQDGLDKLIHLMNRQREQMDRAKLRSAKSTLPENEREKTRHQLTKTVYSK